MKKRLLALLLAGVLLVGSAGAAFTATKTYTPGQFTDVAANAWYAASVKKVYELNLMNGSGATTFNPGGMFTVAEALTVAARMHSLSHGGNGVLPTASGAWYQGAVNYCLQNKLITRSQFDSYTRSATRAEMAGVIRAALPDDQWTAINSVSALPDVNMANEYAQAIFDLYNAGVFTGSDDYGMFQPYAYITRAEVAAIVARCADPAQRKTLNLKPLSQRQAPEIIGGLQPYGWRMSNGRLAYKDPATGKLGYLDGNGKVVIAAQYDSVWNFEGGYAVVRKNYSSGLINTAGAVVVPLEYSSVGNLGNGLIAVQKGDKSGVVKVGGRTIVPCNCNSSGWTGVYAWGKKDRYYGSYDIYDQNGTKLIESAEQPVTNNPLLVVREGNKYAVAVGSKKITEALYDSVEPVENTSFATVKYGNLTGLVSLSGELVAPGTYAEYAFNGDYFAAFKRGTGDQPGEVVVGDATGVLYRADYSGSFWFLQLTVYEDEGTFYVNINSPRGVFFYQDGKSRSVERLDTCFTWKDGDKAYLMNKAGKVFGPRDEYNYNYYRDGDSYGIWDETGEVSGLIYDSGDEAQAAYRKHYYAQPENQEYAIRQSDAGKPIVAYGNDTNGWTNVIEFYKNNMYYDEIQKLSEGYYACRFNTTWYLVHA